MKPSKYTILIIPDNEDGNRQFSITRRQMLSIITGLILLYLFSIDLVSTPLIRSLENDHASLEIPEDHPDAIVVLTAGARDLSYMGIQSFPSSTSMVRLTYGIKLLRELKDVPLIISGGRGDPSKSDLSEGKALGKVALELGISKDMLIIEDRSINTIEGAQRVHAILKGKGKTVILISSASHMGRAVHLFGMADLNVIPAPTDYRGEAMKFNITKRTCFCDANFLNKVRCSIVEKVASTITGSPASIILSVKSSSLR